MPRVTKDSTKKETKTVATKATKKTSTKSKSTASTKKASTKVTKIKPDSVETVEEKLMDKNLVQPIVDTKKSVTKTKKASADSSKKTSAKSTKKASTKTTKKTPSSTEEVNVEVTKKASSTKPKTAKKTSATKKTTTTKKATTTNKKTSTKSTKKATKTTTAKKATTRRKKASTTSKAESLPINEYYDLPYRYNQTVVKILAQTPNKLFVYWDISDEDRERMIKNYGKYFFEATKPVLVIHNLSLNYSFEVEINDFANSWYLDIEDAKCEYYIELGRRPDPYYKVPDNSTVYIPAYIYVSSSNNLEVPNNRVLYNPPIYKKIKFRNVKTGKVIERDISEFPFVSNINNIGEFYNVYDLYKKLYNGEDLNFIHNPSSGLTSSRTYSSQFK